MRNTPIERKLIDETIADFHIKNKTVHKQISKQLLNLLFSHFYNLLNMRI